MTDHFKHHAVGLDSPGARHYAVTPSNSVDLDPRPRALRIGGEGNVAVVDEAGVVVIYACAAGEVLPFRAVRVNQTSTTATGIVAWY